MNWWVKPGSINGPTKTQNNEWHVSWIQVWEDGREVKLGDDFVMFTFAQRFITQQLRKRERDETSSTPAHSG